MGITSYIGAIASFIRRKTKQKVYKGNAGNVHSIHACNKEQHLKWLEEGKCQCCGADSGEYEGICDWCRLT